MGKVGLDDFFAQGGTVDDLMLHVLPAESALARLHGVPVQQQPNPRPLSVIACEPLVPLLFLISGLLPIGLTILGGRPKAGKSWLALLMSLKVATGQDLFGRFPGIECGVLYLALEDSERRILDRTSKILNGAAMPSNFYLETRWPPATGGGIDRIREFLKEHPEVKLLVIDVWGRFQGNSAGNRSAYQNDYAALTALHNLASEFGIAVILVTHTVKPKGFDGAAPLDDIMGTSGVTGAADTILVLKRDRPGPDGATLYVTGRDVDDQQLALTFERDTGMWMLEGTGDRFKMHPSRMSILKALQREGPLKPKDIAEQTGLTPGNARVLLKKMKEQGEVIAEINGTYSLPASDFEMLGEDSVDGMSK